jgi:tRNA modification GTPase
LSCSGTVIIMTDYLRDDDTIAAVATAPGEGGIGVVRISGPDALSTALKIFRPARAKGLENRHITYGHAMNPDTGERVDEVLAVYMRAPHTYTREDVVEISCHGGMVPIRRVLELALRHGARAAGPGEFTRRAFTNGRLDLAQAEAALDVIRARTESAERIALEQLEGGLSKKVNEMRERLTDLCAHVEAHIDFPEEEIAPAAMEEMLDGCVKLADDVQQLAASFHEGRLYREGVRVAIVGRPNVGKSSLLNALLERDRAIVTELPGTTRDVIEEYLNIEGLPVRIMDTAGIREAHDMAEAEGVRRSLKALSEADVVVGVIDLAEPLHAQDREVISKLRGANALLALNKSDREAAFNETFEVPSVRVSARTGERISELKKSIYELASGRRVGEPEGVVVTNLRHKSALDEAVMGLEAAKKAFSDEPLEISALELRSALNAMGRIVGAVTSDDILNRIFSDFCIGK